MEECTYGWYPSATDVYRNAARYHNNPYQLECMYRFQNSKYHTGLISPPVSTISLGLKDPPAPDTRHAPTPPKGYHRAARQRANVDLDQGAPCLVIKPAPRVKPSPIPTPIEVWEKPTKTQATPITVGPPKTDNDEMKYPKFFWPHPHYDPAEEVKMKNLTPEESILKKEDLVWRPSTSCDYDRQKQQRQRIKSAPAHTKRRVRIQTPSFPRPRPVQSARPHRQMPSVPNTHTRRSSHERPQTCPALKSVSLAPVPKRATQSAEPTTTWSEGSRMRPPNPTPNIADLSLEEKDDLSDSEELDNSKDDYDEALEKYGWRAEIPGDPYNLKKTTKRLSYTVTCEEPVIPPEPPTGHMENWQTFFLNTIPQRPATYTIHKEWISEVIHAKRMELQKKQGVKFNFKKYAFAY